MNECAVDENPCRNGLCVDVPGSFRCECPIAGMTLDSSGTLCVDVRRGACWTRINEDGVCEEQASMTLLRSECCATVGVAWGSPCEKCEIAGGKEKMNHDLFVKVVMIN